MKRDNVIIWAKLCGRLRQAIADKLLSAREVSLAAGLCETAIKNIFQGKSLNPGIFTILAIESAMNLPTGWLLGINAEFEPFTADDFLPYVQTSEEADRIADTLQTSVLFDPDTGKPIPGTDTIQTGGQNADT